MSEFYKEKKIEQDDEIKELKDLISKKEEYINSLLQKIEILNSELNNRDNQLRIISNSLSWKLTKPLRSISSLIRKVVIKFKKLKKYINYCKKTDKPTAKYWIKFEKQILTLNENVHKRIGDNYQKWICNNELTNEDLKKQQNQNFNATPKISIVVPLYNTSIDFFRELLYSVEFQTYNNWELCLADGSEEKINEIEKMCRKDLRIKYKYIGENKGISGNTNEAIKLATGDFIAFMDHDDLLPLNSLYEIVKCINENSDVDFIYTDEDKITSNIDLRFEPHFKPDYAPDTLRANNYICHFSVFRNDLVKSIGLFNSKYDGSQDYDFVLRASEKAKKIIHISKVLYHWRVHKQSTSMKFDVKPYVINAGKLAIEDHLKRIGLEGKVFLGINSGTYGIDYKVKGNPKVSILIPNKDGVSILKNCVDSICNKTTYDNYEIVIIENNSEEERTFEYYKELEKNPKIKIIYYKEKGFNYSKIINFGVRNTNSDFVVQLNNDTEILTPNWLERMIGFCQRDDVGAVGVKMYYPDFTIQHAGLIIGCHQVASHVFKGLPKDKSGYFGTENLIQNLNAVTAACIMTKRSIYEEVGFMNEKFAVSFNDIDFCLKIREKNKLIVYNPYVELIHYESKTRGNDLVPDKIERFKKEIDLFLETWKDKLDKGDEYYNKNFSLNSDQYAIKTEK